MNEEDVPEYNDKTKKKQIPRSKAVSDLQSKLSSGALMVFISHCLLCLVR